MENNKYRMYFRYFPLKRQSANNWQQNRCQKFYTFFDVFYAYIEDEIYKYIV